MTFERFYDFCIGFGVGAALMILFFGELYVCVRMY